MEYYRTCHTLDKPSYEIYLVLKGMGTSVREFCPEPSCMYHQPLETTNDLHVDRYLLVTEEPREFVLRFISENLVIGRPHHRTVRITRALEGLRLLLWRCFLRYPQSREGIAEVTVGGRNVKHYRTCRRKRLRTCIATDTSRGPGVSMEGREGVDCVVRAFGEPSWGSHQLLCIQYSTAC